jgi:hypothetical protein
MGPVWLATAATRACAFHSFSSLPFMMKPSICAWRTPPDARHIPLPGKLFGAGPY